MFCDKLGILDEALAKNPPTFYFDPELGLHDLKRTPTMVNMAELHSARSSRLPNTFFELLSLLLAMTLGRAQRLRMITLDQYFSCPVQSAISRTGQCTRSVS
jgi:hypothetical protein